MLVSKKKIFLTLLGFQLTWLSCVFGEYYNFPFAGVIVGSLYLLIFFYYNDFSFRAFKICIIFSLIGYLFDTFLAFSEIFIIKSNVMFGYLPLWLLFLWPSFTTLFVDILVFLKGRPVIAFLMGSTLAPPSYYFGIVLGIAYTNSLLLAIIIMVFFWGLFLVFYCLYLKKINIFSLINLSNNNL